MNPLSRSIANQRGQAIPLVLMTFGAVAAMTAYMLDTSRIAITANEVQAAADVTAAAGARALMLGRDHLADAKALVTKNLIDNSLPSAVNLEALEAGNWSSEGVFTPNLFPLNAVRSQVFYTVDNILIGSVTKNAAHEQSRVTKQAIGAFKGAGSGRATLPIVLGECKFPKDCFEDSCLPVVTQVPDPADNSAWTGFFGQASTAAMQPFFPPGCGGNAVGYGAEVKVGDYINLTNGQLPLLNNVKCLLENLKETNHIIPIVPCKSQYNQQEKVLGFATVVIDEVRSSGSPKGIWLHAIFKVTQPGPSGGGNFGTGSIALVQ
ncbi:MAG TPA: hypothetical protein VEB21_18385 [Terriglobales bacterium]|nr:hypothetical protein [Terriglobales bacterium]